MIEEENVTLIKDTVLDSLLERAFMYDILSENNQLMNEVNWAKVNKQIEKRKRDFLSGYIVVPINNLFD